jgi:very-short-patch-repair endonuclease
MILSVVCRFRTTALSGLSVERLFEQAKELRNRSTEAESYLWKILRKMVNITMN